VDLGEVRQRATDAGVAIPVPFSEWPQRTRGSHRYAPIEEFRHAQVHRLVRQDATIHLGGTPRVTVRVGADPK
jgi:hypothetical protein